MKKLSIIGLLVTILSSTHAFEVDPKTQEIWTQRRIAPLIGRENIFVQTGVLNLTEDKFDKKVLEKNLSLYINNELKKEGFKVTYGTTNPEPNFSKKIESLTITASLTYRYTDMSRRTSVQCEYFLAAHGVMENPVTGMDTRMEIWRKEFHEDFVPAGKFPTGMYNMINDLTKDLIRAKYLYQKNVKKGSSHDAQHEVLNLTPKSEHYLTEGMIALLNKQLNESYQKLPYDIHEKIAREMRWIGYCYGVLGTKKGFNEEAIEAALERELARRVSIKGKANAGVINELGLYLRDNYQDVYELFLNDKTLQ